MEKTIVNFSYTVTVVEPPVQVFAVKEDGSKLLLNTFASEGQHSFLAQTPWTEIVGDWELLSGPFTAAAVIGARDGGSGGQAGADGLSAYELAVQQGYGGDLDSWLASLKGEPGERGEKGEQGPAGEDGKSPYFNSESGHWMYWEAGAWKEGPVGGGDSTHMGSSVESVEVGEKASAGGMYSTSVGYSSCVTGNAPYGVSVGYYASVNAMNGVALGSNANVMGEYGMALGSDSSASRRGVAVGYNAHAEVDGMAFGYGAMAAQGEIVFFTSIDNASDTSTELRIVAPRSQESNAYFDGAAGIVLKEGGGYTRIKFSELGAGGGSGGDGDCGVSFGDSADITIGKKSSAGASGVVLGNYSRGSTTSVVIGNGVQGRDLGTCIIRAGDATSGEDDLLFGFFSGGSPLANQYTDGEPGMGFWNRNDRGQVKSGCVKLADICTMHQGVFSFGAEVFDIDSIQDAIGRE